MGQRLGQHFLRDAAALRAVADALQITPGDTIIEIGAGHGELTQELLALSFKLLVKPATVILIEKDRLLAETLRQKFAVQKNIRVVEGDVREILPLLVLKLKAKNLKLCGNIPYYLTGFLLRMVSELAPLPLRAVFTMQKEVAERIAAEPPHTNQLSASVQFWADPKIVRLVAREAFAPPPKVASAIISLETRKGSRRRGVEPNAYYAAVHALFRQPRKTIVNNIATATDLPKQEVTATLQQQGIAPAARPHTLSIEKIAALSLNFDFPRGKMK